MKRIEIHFKSQLRDIPHSTVITVLAAAAALIAIVIILRVISYDMKGKDAKSKSTNIFKTSRTYKNDNSRTTSHLQSSEHQLPPVEDTFEWYQTCIKTISIRIIFLYRIRIIKNPKNWKNLDGA